MIFFVLCYWAVLSFLPRSYAGEKLSPSIELSPAYALALALGVRSISGPVEHTPKTNKITSKPHDLQTPHSSQDMGYTSFASMTSRLPQSAMEE